MILSSEKIRLLVHANGSSAIKYAVEDLCEDVNAVSGAITESNKNFDIFVGCILDEKTREFLANAEIHYSDIEGKVEAHKIVVEHEKCFILGADVLGTVYGVYEFCSSTLGVSPVKFWIDGEYERKEKIEVKEVVVTDFSYRYRCFALSDEDCLTALSAQTKRRLNPKDKFVNVLSSKFVAQASKTALRLKYNVIIPATMLNILNPNEETIVKSVTSLGLYVTQNFYEPMGVSSTTWETYWNMKDRKGLKPSYSENKDCFIEMWREYVDKWAEYPNVLWQVGLLSSQYQSGTFYDDRKIVSDDETCETVCDAIAMQCSIIYDKLGYDNVKFILYQDPYIQKVLDDKSFDLSENTILVRPQTRNPVKQNKEFLSEGFAFMSANTASGEHNVQMPDYGAINRLKSQYKSSSTFAYLSVGNIRERVFSIMNFAKAVVDIDKISQAPTVVCDELFGNKDVLDAYKRFYESYRYFELPLTDITVYNLIKKYAKVGIGQKNKITINNFMGETLSIKTDKFINKIEKSMIDLLQLAINLDFIYKINKNQSYYEYSLKMQVRVLAKLYSALANVLRFNYNEDKNHLILALEDLNVVKLAFESMAYGKWEGAYKKNLFDLAALITQVKEVYVSVNKGVL